MAKKVPHKPAPHRIYVKLSPEKQEELRRVAAEIESEKDELMAKGREIKRRQDRRNAQLSEVFQALKAEREAQGLSLADMQERSGMSRESISKLENLVNPNPTIATIERYAEALGKRVVLTLEPIG